MNSIVFFIVGDYPFGNKNTARIKSLIDEFTHLEYQCIICKTYPTSFSNSFENKEFELHLSSNTVQLSYSNNYQSNKILRFFQILSGITRSILKVARLNESTIVYFYNPTLFDNIFAMLVARLRGLRVVVDQTELYSIERYRLINRISEYVVAKSANLLLTISSTLYLHFQRVRSKPSIKFPIVVELKRFHTSNIERKGLIGYVGSFAEKDGVSLMLHSFQIAVTKNHNLTLRLIGDNPYQSATICKIREMNIEKWVELTGSVSFEDIPKLLNECDTFIMNRNSSKFAETGYPIKLGEYFACNRPVLMSDGPGYSEDFTHLQEAIKYKVDDAQALADAIIFRYENDTLAREVSQRGYDYAAAHFDSKKQVKKLVKILDEL